MMVKTHVPIGVATALASSAVFNINPEPIVIASAIIGSMMPDIDHPGSMINQKVLISKTGLGKTITYIILGFLSMVIYIKYKKMDFLPYTIPLFGIIAISKHRGITHSLLGCSIILFIVNKIGSIIGQQDIIIPFAIGYIMHLFADYFTNHGITLLYPKKKRYKFIKTINTNGFEEKMIGVITSILLVYVFTNNILPYYVRDIRFF